MLAISIILLISWGILRLSGDSFRVLGLYPAGLRSAQIFIGFVPAAILASIYYFITIKVLDAEVVLNESYSLLNFLSGSWWTLRSVLFEELIFRGALLFLAIKYLGKFKGILISSIAFGIFHWFSYNILGDTIQMIYVFSITGIGGLMFAYAYAETRSLYLPIGLHFGWNLITITIFSQGPLGEQLLVSSTENVREGWWNLFFFLYQVILLPGITFIYLYFYLDRPQTLYAKKGV